ncbi:lysosomal amino acid transporter 1 homolog isoform X2 [Apostichopus japonicus]|uniref:lysosomal amino acid transporter 1 homolog isoform X2 n=1 Tax=Stichopus japonicus TaxID=307972 RepID=UPI003AB1B6E7
MMADSYSMLSHLHVPINTGCNSTYANWTYTIFGECVHNEMQMAGFIIGLISIGFWIVVFFPQFYEAYKNGAVDQALSPLFLIMWLLGDISNLTGCLLSGQLPTQIYVAYYYIFMDVCILSQFLYYKIKNRHRTVRAYEPDPINRPTYSSTAQVEPRHVIYCCLVFSAFYGTSLLSWPQGPQIKSGHHIGAGRSLLSYEEQTCMVYFGQSGDCMFTDSEDLIGYIFGVVSGICYFMSRSPQLYKNFKRKSVEGISIFMFIITVLGNLTYGLSVILEDTSLVFLCRHLPWLVGSIGTLVFDVSLLLQFAVYGKKPSLSGESQPLLA